EETKAYMRETIDYAERLTRAALEKLPDGEWSFEDWIDDDGVDYGKPIRLFVTIRKKGGHMVVDWTGTHPQVKGAINNTLSFTKAASYTGVRSVLPQGIPNNEGVFRAIEVICPPGTVGNGVLPAACAARGLTGFRMTDCMFGALAMMLPDKVKAAGDGGNTGVSIGGYYADRKPFIYVDFTCGAWGARPWADGLDGNSHMFANMASQPIEVTETQQPIQFLSSEFVDDQAGAGGWGDPLERDPAAVLRDVRNELLSPAKAAADYGVIIASGKVDSAASTKRRAEIRAARGWREVPAVQRNDPLPHARKAA